MYVRGLPIQSSFDEMSKNGPPCFKIRLPCFCVPISKINIFFESDGYYVVQNTENVEIVRQGKVIFRLWVWFDRGMWGVEHFFQVPKCKAPCVCI